MKGIFMNFKQLLIPPLLGLPLMFMGCGSNTSTGPATDNSGSKTDSTINNNAWIINITKEVSQNLFESGTNQGSLVNVQSVETKTVDDLVYTVV